MGRNKWTRAEDKLFEEALVIFSDHKLDNFKWKKIAGYVPGRSLEELKAHYDDLLHDIDQIDSGRVELPCYSDGFCRISFAGSKNSKGDVDRKRGTPWTEEEHRFFLIGLEKYGKGDWRSISRNVVITRTPTQVASHAQKYFLRQNSGRKERKRNSIHDITTVDRKSGSPPGTTLQQTNASPHYGATQEGGSFGYQNFGFPL